MGHWASGFVRSRKSVVTLRRKVWVVSRWAGGDWTTEGQRDRRRDGRRRGGAGIFALRDYADIVLVDIVEGLPRAKALDLAETAPVIGL